MTSMHCTVAALCVYYTSCIVLLLQRLFSAAGCSDGGYDMEWGCSGQPAWLGPTSPQGQRHHPCPAHVLEHTQRSAVLVGLSGRAVTFPNKRCVQFFSLQLSRSLSGIGCAVALVLTPASPNFPAGRTCRPTCLRVVTDIAISNKPAWQFFKRLGFQPGAASGSTAEAVLELQLEPAEGSLLKAAAPPPGTLDTRGNAAATMGQRLRSKNCNAMGAVQWSTVPSPCRKWTPARQHMRGSAAVCHARTFQPVRNSRGTTRFLTTRIAL